MRWTHDHDVSQVAQFEAVQQELQVSQLCGAGGQRRDTMTDLTTNYSLGPLFTSNNTDSLLDANHHCGKSALKKDVQTVYLWRKSRSQNSCTSSC